MHDHVTPDGAKAMMRRGRLIFAALLMGLLVACWIAWRGYDDAHQQLRAGQAQLTAIERDVAEIIALRGLDQHIADRKPPERDVIARVNAALTRAGLPASALTSLTPESDAALPDNSQYHRQTLRLSLRSLDIQRLGTFLSAWRNSQLVWTITQIELTHSRERNCEMCYDATLVLSAIYVQGADA